MSARAAWKVDVPVRAGHEPGHSGGGVAPEHTHHRCSGQRVLVRQAGVAQGDEAGPRYAKKSRESGVFSGARSSGVAAAGISRASICLAYSKPRDLRLVSSTVAVGPIAGRWTTGFLLTCRVFGGNRLRPWSSCLKRG